MFIVFRIRQKSLLMCFNESDGKEAFEAAISRNVSFGLFRPNSQTLWPPKWGVWEPEYMWYFERVRQLTGT